MARPLSPTGAAAPGAPPAEPFQQLEAVMLRQMLQSSGAFHGSDSPGAQLRADLFVETLAEAVAKAGGLGIGRMLERQLGAGGAARATATAAAPAAAPTASLQGFRHPLSGPAHLAQLAHLASTPASRPPVTSAPATRPPMAQVSATSATSPPMSQVSAPYDSLEDPNCDAPLPEDPSADSIDAYQPAPTATTMARSGARPSFSASRALIRYRERAEVQGADHPSRASGGK
jgi:Rod binding domain-containing protein